MGILRKVYKFFKKEINDVSEEIKDDIVNTSDKLVEKGKNAGFKLLKGGLYYSKRACQISFKTAIFVPAFIAVKVFDNNEPYYGTSSEEENKIFNKEDWEKFREMVIESEGWGFNKKKDE